MAYNIPTGNFGMRQAGGLRVNATPQDGQQALGQAMQGLERTAEGIVQDVQGQEIQALKEQRRKELEAKAAADHAQAQVATNSGHDKLADLHDEIAQGVIDGSIEKDKAEATFNERATGLLGDVTEQVPQQYRPAAESALRASADRLGNKVRRAVTERDRMDVTAGLNQTLEYLQRQYPADPEGATKRAMDNIDQLGPHSNYTPEKLQALRQGWKESTQYTSGYEAISAGREDPKALARAEKLVTEGLPDIDPQKRAVLLDRAQNYRLAQEQRADMLRRRALAEADHRLNVAGAAYAAGAKLAEEGALNPQYAEDQLKLMAGTPFQSAFKQLLETQRQNGPLAAQAPSTLRQAIDQVNAQITRDGMTPELSAQRDRLTKVMTAQESDIQKMGALRAAEKRTVVPPAPPLDFSQGPVSVAQQIKARESLVAKVSAWTGKAESPVYPEEALQLHSQLQSLAPKERAGMVAALSAAMGPAQAQAFSQQLDKHDHTMALGMSLGAASTTEGRPASTLLFMGQQALKDKGIKEDHSAVTGDRAQIAEIIGDTLPGKARSDAIDAATLIYQGFKADGQSLDYGRAVNLAIGGRLVDHAGTKVPIPAGMDRDHFREKLSAIKPADIQAEGDGFIHSTSGERVPISVFASQLGTAQLMPSGPLPAARGRYFVRMGAGIALTTSGAPVVIDVNR